MFLISIVLRLHTSGHVRPNAQFPPTKHSLTAAQAHSSFHLLRQRGHGQINECQLQSPVGGVKGVTFLLNWGGVNDLERREVPWLVKTQETSLLGPIRHNTTNFVSFRQFLWFWPFRISRDESNLLVEWSNLLVESLAWNSNSHNGQIKLVQS